MKSPRTPGEWQQAMDFAQAALEIDAAREYGLIQGGPTVRVARCRRLLARGARPGYAPRAVTLDGYIRALARHLPPHNLAPR